MAAKPKKSSPHGARGTKRNTSGPITVRPSKWADHAVVGQHLRKAKTGSPAKLFGAGSETASDIKLREPEKAPALSRKAANELMARLKTHVATVTRPARLSSSQITALLRELAATYEQTGLPPPLPDKAPELWSEREGRSENPVAFLRRVYAPWLGRGLIRPHVKALDPGLYNAFNVWCHRNPDDTLPELLTLSARIDEMVEDLSGRYEPEDLRKLGLALQMRHRKRK
ncbi:MAG: hypothetical protein AB7U75_07380 [Hyphomicrobiaceae bacterium]